MKSLVVLLLTLVLGQSALGGDSDSKPNVIFLMIDDCSAVEFSCYGTPQHPAGNQTPVIDALASRGLRFSTCWATPLCMPTRALLMTGKYGCDTKIYGNRLKKNSADFPEKHVPVSKVMQQNGYETAIAGKWHLPGHVEDEAYGWGEYSLLGGYMTPKNKEIEWDGLWFSWDNAAHTFRDKAIIGKNKGFYPALYWHGAVIENGRLLPSDSETYAPDLCQKFALDFIGQPRDKPFFLYYPMVLPHDPWIGPPDNDDPSKKMKPGVSSLVQRVEYYVDELMKAVDEAGILENTIIVFTADNATLKNGKGSGSELGTRVPLIVAGGPLKKTGVSDVLVDFADMYPTILELAGIDPKDRNGLDGQSFLPLLRGEPFQGKEYLFSYVDMERTVRNRDFMMDGCGGIWRCSADGNLLDYEPVSEAEGAAKIRSKFMDYLESYPAPSEEEFASSRIDEVSRREPWPSFHPSMTKAVDQGDQWMHDERRLGE